MHASGIIGILIGGLIIGALGRLILPGRQPIGCLFTTLIGVAGAAFGYYLGHTLAGFGDFVTLVIQVLVAAALVALFGGISRRGQPRM